MPPVTHRRNRVASGSWYAGPPKSPMPPPHQMHMDNGSTLKVLFLAPLGHLSLACIDTLCARSPVLVLSPPSLPPCVPWPYPQALSMKLSLSFSPHAKGKPLLRQVGNNFWR